MLHVLCFVSQASTHARLRAELAHCAHVELATERPPGRRSMAQLTADAILADLLDGAGRPLAASLALQQDPACGVPVIALVKPRPNELRAIGEAARAGVDIVMPGHENVADALQAILRNTSRLRHSRLQRVLPLAPSLAARSLLEDCLRAPSHATTAKSLAAAFGCAPRTLSRRFASAGLPSAGSVLRWLRVLGAVATLGQGASARAAASGNGYASVAALRQSLRALTGLSIASARSADAVATVLQSLARMLRPGDGHPPCPSPAPARCDWPRRTDAPAPP